jgi:uncharacterized membrane protein YgcG
MKHVRSRWEPANSSGARAHLALQLGALLPRPPLGRAAPRRSRLLLPLLPLDLLPQPRLHLLHRPMLRLQPLLQPQPPSAPSVGKASALPPASSTEERRALAAHGKARRAARPGAGWRFRHTGTEGSKCALMDRRGQQAPFTARGPHKPARTAARSRRYASTGAADLRRGRGLSRDDARPCSYRPVHCATGWGPEDRGVRHTHARAPRRSRVRVLAPASRARGPGPAHQASARLRARGHLAGLGLRCGPLLALLVQGLPACPRQARAGRTRSGGQEGGQGDRRGQGGRIDARGGSDGGGRVGGGRGGAREVGEGGMQEVLGRGREGERGLNRRTASAPVRAGGVGSPAAPAAPPPPAEAPPPAHDPACDLTAPGLRRAARGVSLGPPALLASAALNPCMQDALHGVVKHGHWSNWAP